MCDVDSVDKQIEVPSHIPFVDASSNCEHTGKLCHTESNGKHQILESLLGQQASTKMFVRLGEGSKSFSLEIQTKQQLGHQFPEKAPWTAILLENTKIN